MCAKMANDSSKPNQNAQRKRSRSTSTQGPKKECQCKVKGRLKKVIEKVPEGSENLEKPIIIQNNDCKCNKHFAIGDLPHKPQTPPRNDVIRTTTYSQCDCYTSPGFTCVRKITECLEFNEHDEDAVEARLKENKCNIFTNTVDDREEEEKIVIEKKDIALYCYHGDFKTPEKKDIAIVTNLDGNGTESSTLKDCKNLPSTLSLFTLIQKTDISLNCCEKDFNNNNKSLDKINNNLPEKSNKLDCSVEANFTKTNVLEDLGKSNKTTNFNNLNTKSISTSKILSLYTNVKRKDISTECISETRQEIIVNYATVACSCGDKKNKQQLNFKCFCDSCKCTLCLDPNRKTNSAAGEQPQGICNCEECKCLKCLFPNKAKKSEDVCTCLVSEPAKPPPQKFDCLCQDCKCLKCLDPNKGKKSDPKSSCTCTGGSKSGDTNACSCVGCVCIKCKFIGNSQGDGGGGGSGPKPCSDPCECSPCKCAKAASQSSKTAVSVSICKKHVEDYEPCMCPICKCQPCKDPTKRGTTQEASLEPCMCSVCKCNPCKDPSKKSPGSQCTCTKEKPAVSSAPCECIDCKCDPCQDPNKSKTGKSTQKVNKPCGNIHCGCAKCDCPPEGGLLACNCKTCTCPNCTRKPKQAKDDKKMCDCKDCTCPVCTRKPKSASGKGDDKKMCDCKSCTCPVCSRKPKGAAAEGDKKGCDCKDCTCPVCTRKPKQGGGEDLKTCDCKDCSCPICTRKPKGAAQSGDKKACDCKNCTCPSCSRKPKQGGEEMKMCDCKDCSCPICTRKPKQAQSGGKDDDKKACDCKNCTCPSCSRKPKQGGGEEKKMCDCKDCSCPICTRKPKGAAQAGDKKACNCKDCTCPSCPLKPKQGDKKACSCKNCTCPSCPLKPKQGGGEDLKMCDCKDCTCPICSRKPKQAQSGGKDGDKKACDCKNCTCPSCSRKPKQGGGEDTKMCDCKDCSCPICTRKPKQAQSGGKDGDKKACDCKNCTCPSCSRKPKQGGGEDTKMCDCKDCSCPICTRKPKQAQSGGKDGDKKACDCKNCTCSSCSRKPKQGGGEEKKMCDCKDCSCPICTRKPKEAAQSGDKKACNCKDCTCPSCPLKPKQGDKKACSCKNCTCPSCPLKPKQGGGEDLKMCDCKDCTCPICSRKPKQAQSGGKDGDNKACNCKTCTCPSCSRKPKQAENENKGDQKSCDCKQCSCPVCTRKGGAKDSSDQKMCDCKNCTCPVCSRKPKDGQSGGQKMCNCKTCTCTECPKKGGAPAQSGDQKGCICTDCSCPVCTRKEKSGDDKKMCDCKPNCTCPVCTRKPEGTPAGKPRGPCKCKQCKCAEKSGSSFPGGEKKMCDCKPNCKCSLCTRKSTGQGQGEGKKCNCPVCKCLGNKSGSSGACKCGDCKCIECSAMTDDKKDIQCVCKPCSCLECENMPSGNKVVVCSLCTWSERSISLKNVAFDPNHSLKPDASGKTEYASACSCVECIDLKGIGDASDKRICHCTNCICANCSMQTSNKTGSGDLRFLSRKQSEVIHGNKTKRTKSKHRRSKSRKHSRERHKDFNTMPPPFEVPKKMLLNADTCTCIICNSRRNTRSPSTNPPLQTHSILKSTPEVITLTSKSTKTDKLPMICAYENIHQQIMSVIEPPTPSSFAKHQKTIEDLLKRKHQNIETNLIIPNQTLDVKEPVIVDKRTEELFEKTSVKQTNKNNLKLSKRLKTFDRKESNNITAPSYPLIKRASDFNETMSNLKIAFQCLEKKGKAKDYLIEALSEALKALDSKSTIENILNASSKGNPPDYDKTDDIKLLDKCIKQRDSKNKNRTISAPPHRLKRSPTPSKNYNGSPDSDSFNQKSSELIKKINYESTTCIPSGNTFDKSSKKSTSDQSCKYSDNNIPSYCIPNLKMDSFTNNIGKMIGDGKSAKETSSKSNINKNKKPDSPSVTNLKTAIKTLETRCKAKDMFIVAATEELRKHISSNTLLKILNVVPLALDKRHQSESVQGEEKVNRILANDVKIQKGKKKVDAGFNNDRKLKNINLDDFEISTVTRITADSLIVKWKPPKSKAVRGYEVLVNGKDKMKVISGHRTCTMIHSVDLSKTVFITIYALTSYGRCEPPATAIYELQSK